MCLAVPAQVVSREHTGAVVDLHGNRLPVSVLLVPEVEPGDWVLVHAGFAIQQVDADYVGSFAVTADILSRPPREGGT